MENLHFQLEPQLQFGPLFGIRRVVPRVNGSGIQITTPNCSFAEQRVFASDTRGFAARPLAGFAAPSALGRALNNHNTTTHHHTPHHTAPHPPYTTVFLVSIYPHSVPWTQTPLLTPPLQCFVGSRSTPRTVRLPNDVRAMHAPTKAPGASCICVSPTIHSCTLTICDLTADWPYANPPRRRPVASSSVTGLRRRAGCRFQRNWGRPQRQQRPRWRRPFSHAAASRKWGC